MYVACDLRRRKRRLLRFYLLSFPLTQWQIMGIDIRLTRGSSMARLTPNLRFAIVLPHNLRGDDYCPTMDAYSTQHEAIFI